MPPILILGLDGASFDALRPLAADGTMPALAGLLDRAAQAPLRSTVPPITPAAWATFLTGKRPGIHGIWDFRLYDPTTYGDGFVSHRALQDRTLFSLLAEAGRRVAVINLPLMYPPPEDGGTVVAGFDAPSTASAFTWPPALRERILAAHPTYRFVATLSAGDDPAQCAAFVDEAEHSMAQKFAVAGMLLDDGPLDVLCLHLQDTDALQHKLWCELVDGARDPARHALMRRAYAALDGHIGTLLARLPSDTTIVVVSDHGFGPHRGRVFPNVLLRGWGMLAQPGRRWARFQRSVQKRLAQVGLAETPTRPSRSWEVAVREQGFADALPVDWATTRAYVAVAEIYGLLYLNLRGREPQGIVEPGADAERTCDELVARFMAVRDPSDGSAVFAEVLRGTDVAPVDRHGRRPDLVLVPRGDLTVGRDLNDRLWLERYPRTLGTHRTDGVLMVAGPGVRPGPLATSPGIEDVAPSVLAASGLPVPEDMEGRVLTELFVDPPVVRRGPAAVRGVATVDGLTDDEAADVAERLRALGYLA